MQMAGLGADECLDPSLMSAFEDGAVDQFGPWYADADAGPPSPFDLSTIDPDLLALYPEHKDNSSTRSRVPVDAQSLSLSAPRPRDESRAPDLTTDNTESRVHHDSLLSMSGQTCAGQSETDNTESRVHHDSLLSMSGQTCAGRSESPPPIWIPLRTSALPSDARTTAIYSRDARSSAPPAQPTPTANPSIPSLAAQHNPPAQSQKRARSPTPDSEEDDFAASFMRKRRVAAGML